MHRDTSLRVNWPYIVFVASVGTGAIVLIAWEITSQFYLEWSQGLPTSGGWSWPVVFLLDSACALIGGALHWKIYCDAKTTIDQNGIFQPSLFGLRNISWDQVTRVEVFGGVGYHIYSGKKKIVITPYAYKDPESVIEMLRLNVAASNRGTT